MAKVALRQRIAAPSGARRDDRETDVTIGDGATAIGDNIVLVGEFGTLTISANGTYNYLVTNQGNGDAYLQTCKQKRH